MRGLVLVVAGSLALGGCSALGGNADVAAEAGGQTMRSEQLAAVLNKIEGQRPTTELADFVANFWVDLTLMGQALVTSGVPADSAAIAQALWFELSQARISAWHDTLMSRRIAISDEMVRAFHDSAGARVFQHILVQGGPTRADTNQALAKVREVQAGLRSGRSFADYASELNPDASRETGGLMPPMPRGGFVPEFDNAAWALAPGQTSGVVTTQFGWHFVRRPTFEEAAPLLRDSLRNAVRRNADSVYSTELIAAKRIEVEESAPASMRTALNDLDKARGSRRRIATWDGGSLDVAEMARWVSALPPGFPQSLREQPDSSLKNFATVLAQNIIMLAQADSASIPVPALNWQAMQLTYQVSIDQMRTALGLGEPEFADSVGTPAERRQKASERVNAYLDRVAAGQLQRRQIIPGMANALRAGASHRVNAAGVARAVELAMVRWVADSSLAAAGAGAAPPAGALPPGAVTPAPGGPPVP